MSKSSAPIRIMVVDDEKDVTSVLQMLLEDSGYNVDIFPSSRAALAAFKPETYKMALIDLKMPGMDGFELSKQLTAADSDIKICYMTAFDWHRLPTSQRVPESEIPSDRYFRKPLN